MLNIDNLEINCMDLLQNLNKEQLAAVTHKDGPLLIVAGAGTGKTTVITQRIAYLIEQGKVKTDEILALTFTEKAAGEMEERVDRLLPMGYLDLWIYTFHGFGERILKEHAHEIGLSAESRLLNEFEQWALIKKNLDKFSLDYYRPRGNPTKFIHALIKHFSRLKDEDISPAEYLSYADELRENLDNMLTGSKKKGSRNFHPSSEYKQFSISNFQTDDKKIAEQEIIRINEVANAYHVYQQLLLDNDAMDFGDLINYTLQLFRTRPKILEKYRQQFKYILLDEFQDTNWAQYELVKLFSAPRNNLTVVCDDDQSIYKFRGASVSNILQFNKDYAKAKQIVLSKNYRNTQNILDLAYDFIQLNNPNRLEWEMNKKTRKQENKKTRKISINKKLIAEEKGEGEIVVIKGSDVHDEIRQVVEKIAELKTEDKDLNWNDFAVLVRANESAKEICATLEVAGLPYQFLASRGLYVKSVILDVVSYLKLLDNYHENEAVYRVLNIGIFKFSRKEIMDFNYMARKKAWSLYHAAKEAKNYFGSETGKKIDFLFNLIVKHTALARYKNISEVFLAFLHDSGYLKAITKESEQASREKFSYLNQFKRRIDKFEAGSDIKTTKVFLEELNSEIEAGEEGSIAPDIESGPEAIKVMTAHAAKGLEFKYVFITSLVDKRFPTIRRSEKIEIPEALVKEILQAGDMHIEEERRLFYVAVTRAKAGIFFSWAPDYGGKRKKKASQFLLEANLVKPGVDKTKKSQAEIFSKAKPKQKEAGSDQVKNKLPAYFSYTQLAAFNNCPFQYRFAHILKVARKSKFTFSFGQTMHLTMQKLFMLINEKKGLGQGSLFKEASDKDSKGKVNISFDEILEIYKQSWIDDWYDCPEQKEEYKKQGLESLKAYFNLHKDNWPAAISLEQGINLKVGGYRIFGKIDRIDDLGGGSIQIVDYKTGQPKTKDKISKEDKEQLLIYQLGAGQALDKKISNLQFYYLDNNSDVNFLGSQKDLEEMEEKIIERIKAIEAAAKNNDFPAKPGPLCKYCDFFNICEYRKN
ncbi:hypothetical protein DRH27_03310 [Candidatus Falkowbacteria bacterium]|nr:MAG: hypothetical protein DRH27_03310 [Candidatus Falkowbacteria bacterium]